jgi:hypothetical protein
LHRRVDGRDEPRTRRRHGGLAREEQRVGVVVGYGVDALGVVAALVEFPEDHVYGRDHLGGVPPAVAVEDLVEPLPAEHVARADAEHVAAGPLLLVAERERDDVPSFELVGDLHKLLDGARNFGHQALVVVDDDLLDLGGYPVGLAVVGGPLPCPVVDLPAVLLVRVV